MITGCKLYSSLAFKHSCHTELSSLQRAEMRKLNAGEAGDAGVRQSQSGDDVGVEELLLKGEYYIFTFVSLSAL